MRKKPRKRPARANNAQIDSAAIGRAKIILPRLHQFASQARTLPPRLHAQQSKVTAFSPQFQVHASGKPMRIFGNKKLPFFQDRKSTRLNSSHGYISYAVFCLKKKKTSNLTVH